LYKYVPALRFVLNDDSSNLYIRCKGSRMKSLTFVLVLMSFFSLFGQSKVEVACIGNSITEGLDIEKGKRYPDQLQALLGNKYEVKNFGVSGRTLLKRGDYPYWNEQKYKEALKWNPDVVIIKLGTNDSKPQNWVYANEFEQNYREFIQSFKGLSSNPKIYVCTPVPVFKEAWGITDPIVKNQIVPMVKSVAQAEGVTLIDLYTPLIGKAELVPDGVHPNAAGAAVMAEQIYKAIK
jgi:acyl-CoA thioesterase I